jgi:hypothetical protein
MSNAFIAPNFDTIPDELRQVPNWVLWKAEGNPGEKPRKVPYTPGTNTRASSTDPTTWRSFNETIVAFRRGGFTGIGFVLDGSGIAGVDIDHCVIKGVVEPAALTFLGDFGAGYIEISPSGTGLRAFGYAENLKTGAKGKFRGLDVELYSTGRYLTVTGYCIKSEPIGPLNHFSELAERIRADKVVNPQTGETTIAAPDQRHANLLQRILKGEVFHDSLRDLAASLVATGMHDGAVINHLSAVMDASHAPHDDRWKARRAQIPELVRSASAKFGLPPVDFSGLLANMATKVPTVGEKAAPGPRFTFLTADDLRALPPLLWLILFVLPALGLVVIYGPSGSGKTFLVIDLVMAIAEGRSWFGCRVKPTIVLYICLEGEAGLRLRVQAWEVHHGRRVPDGVRMMIQPFDLTDLNCVHELAAQIPAGAVVFIDTLNRAAPTADENSSKDMGAILEAAKLLQNLIQGLVVLVHHTGKDSTRGLRGHSSLFAACDAVIEVSRGEDYREWKVAKSKDGADGGSHGFALEVVELGVDEFGDAITSCVVVPDQDDSPPREKALTERQSDGLSTFQSAAVLVGVLTSAGEFDGLHVEKWREAFYSQCLAVSANAKRVAFQRARDDLVKLGRLTANNDIYRLAGVTSGFQNKLIADAIRKRQATSTPAQ